LVTGEASGTSLISYAVTNSCGTTTETLLVTVTALPTITITTPSTCAADLLTYSVGVTVSSGTVTSTAGTVFNSSGNLWTISSVPSGTGITLTVTDGNGCLKTLSVTAPDCNCPVIAPPLSGGDKSYCSGSSIPAITASVLAGETVDWFAGSTAGSAIATGVTSYTPSSAGTYYAEARNTTTGCKSNTRTLVTLTANILPVPTITGPASACTGSTANVYATETGMSGYTWSVSAGGTITAGTGSSSITVTWNTAGAQTVSVNYTNGNGCTAATAKTINITVNALPIPTIAGPATACAGSTGNFYTTETVMSGYAWSVSAGGTITAGTGTSSITVTWNTAGSQTVSVNYTNGNGCTAATAKTNNVTVNALPAPTISGPASACVGSIGNVYITETGMSGYAWSVSAGGTITAGTGTSSITVTWNTAGSQTVSVNYTNGNGCTAATAKTNNVTVNPLPVPTITGPAAPCVNSTGNVYSTAAGMTNYIWVVSSGGTVTAGGGTGNNTVTVTWTTTGAQTISVNYTNGSTCTASAPAIYNVTVDACFKTLILNSIMLQGLYNGGGTMRQASNGGGPQWPLGIADHITVELHSSSNYSNIVYTISNVSLNTNGTATISSIPSSSNGSYYITVKHRNSLETTTSTAVSFAGSTITQSFGSRANVYGNNLALSLDGHYMIYGGDVNLDGIVDTGDMNDVDNGSTAILFGYNAADANGDGIVDTSDMNIVDNNSTAIVIVRLPH
jgi:hypothetical protein